MRWYIKLLLSATLVLTLAWALLTVAVAGFTAQFFHGDAPANSPIFWFDVGTVTGFVYPALFAAVGSASIILYFYSSRVLSKLFSCCCCCCSCFFFFSVMVSSVCVLVLGLALDPDYDPGLETFLHDKFGCSFNATFPAPTSGAVLVSNSDPDCMGPYFIPAYVSVGLVAAANIIASLCTFIFMAVNIESSLSSTSDYEQLG